MKYLKENSVLHLAFVERSITNIKCKQICNTVLHYKPMDPSWNMKVWIYKLYTTFSKMCLTMFLTSLTWLSNKKNKRN
jgi:hypothetical protein